MTKTRLTTLILGSLLSTFVAQGAPPHTIERGSSISVGVQFRAVARVKAARLTWQTYDEIKPKQSEMKRGFTCVVDVTIVSETDVTFACKVPLTIADGHYVLTSIAVETDDSDRNYSFTKDFPMDLYMNIRGGPEVAVAGLKALVLK